jgi:hypothetical protein
MGHISVLFIFALILVLTLFYRSSSSTHFINKYVLIVCKCGECVDEWHVIIFDPSIIYLAPFPAWFIVPFHHFLLPGGNCLHILHCFKNVICKEEEIWVVGLRLIYTILITNNSIQVNHLFCFCMHEILFVLLFHWLWLSIEHNNKIIQWNM